MERRATALTDLAKGEQVSVTAGERCVEVMLQDEIPFGHKYALRDIIALGNHSSSAGILVIGLGCEGTDAYKVNDGGLIPVIKVLANPKRMQLIADNVDFDASPVIRGERSVAEMGPELYDEILAVAAGKLTKSEIHGHYEA